MRHPLSAKCNRITVTLPAFRHPRDGMMRTAIVLPKELADAIGAEVASAYDTLGHPTLPPGDAHGATWLSTRQAHGWRAEVRGGSQK